MLPFWPHELEEFEDFIGEVPEEYEKLIAITDHVMTRDQRQQVRGLVVLALAGLLVDPSPAGIVRMVVRGEYD